MIDKPHGATPGSLTVSRIAEIRKVSRKGWAGSEMTVNEWNELLTLAQDALRMRSAAGATQRSPIKGKFWRCVCGVTNMPSAKKCGVCGKKR